MGPQSPIFMVFMRKDGKIFHGYVRNNQRVTAGSPTAITHYLDEKEHDLNQTSVEFCSMPLIFRGCISRIPAGAFESMKSMLFLFPVWWDVDSFPWRVPGTKTSLQTKAAGKQPFCPRETSSTFMVDVLFLWWNIITLGEYPHFLLINLNRNTVHMMFILQFQWIFLDSSW